jgi:hypothetical protein
MKIYGMLVYSLKSKVIIPNIWILKHFFNGCGQKLEKLVSNHPKSGDKEYLIWGNVFVLLFFLKYMHINNQRTLLHVYTYFILSMIIYCATLYRWVAFSRPASSCCYCDIFVEALKSIFHWSLILYWWERRHKSKIIIILNIKNALPRIDAQLCNYSNSSKHIWVVAHTSVSENLLQASPRLEPLVHTVIDSRGGIWTKSVARRRARLTINQNNETNVSTLNSRHRSTYSKPSNLNNRHRSTKTIKKNKMFESWISQVGSFSRLNKPDRLILKIK